jgi:uncharacterized heparinase superfamily protein
MVKRSNPLLSRAFENAGFYVMRSERLYLFAACQPIGVNRLGPHKHNDWLSFDLCLDGQPVIIDPGTYCYTGNMEMRRLFRSTSYHNTVVVDGAEQVDIHNSTFALVRPQGEATVLLWESDEDRDLLEAEHTGYARLANQVIHRRRFLLDKDKHCLKIEDSFSGLGEHELEWRLHLEAGLNVQVEGQTAIIAKGKPIMSIVFSDSAHLLIQPGWVSKAYNRRQEAKIIYWRRQQELSHGNTFELQLAPLG